MALKPGERLLCSFCQKTQEQVRKLIMSPANLPRSCVCDRCVEAAYQILNNLTDAKEVTETTGMHVEAIPDRQLRCSFCGKSRKNVETLIRPASRFPRVEICDECIRVCVQILDDEAREEGREVHRPEPVDKTTVEETPGEQIGKRASLIDQIADRIFRGH